MPYPVPPHALSSESSSDALSSESWITIARESEEVMLKSEPGVGTGNGDRLDVGVVMEWTQD